MPKVLKFGGISVGSAENMKRVAHIIGSEGANIVVLSAMWILNRRVLPRASWIPLQQFP